MRSHTVRTSCLLSAVVALSSLGLATVAAQSPSTAAQPAAARAGVQAPTTTIFQLASINLLGAGHTDTKNPRRGFAKSDVRLRLTKQIMDQRGIDVVGFQEMHGAQANQWTREQKGVWGVFPGNTMTPNAGHNSISWRANTFQLVEKHTVNIPYFNGTEFPMPYVLLKHIATGQTAWFVNVHNPANTAGNAKKWRAEAIRREAALVNQLRAQNPSVPVFLTGDMNDRQEFFCPMASSTSLAAANGGYAKGATCTPPSPMRVDWLMGTPDATFTGYTALQDARVKAATDHPFIIANVNIASQRVRSSPVNRVVVIAVDGLGGSKLTKVGPSGAPMLHRLMRQGASTLNGRTSRESTQSLPNLVSLLSGRRVGRSAGGHGVRKNVDTRNSIHASAGTYVSSIFDLAHNLGRRTAFYSSIGRSGTILRSYDRARGGGDPYGIDNGRKKIDFGGISKNDTAVARALNKRLRSSPAVLSVAEFSGPEALGTTKGFGSAAYRAALKRVDGLVGTTINTINSSPKLRGHTMVVLTGLSGGTGKSNADQKRPQNYQVPMIVWGPGVTPGADLYALNQSWTNPLRERTVYGANAPIFVGDLANLVTMQLQLPPLPGSQSNLGQTLQPWKNS